MSSFFIFNIKNSLILIVDREFCLLSENDHLINPETEHILKELSTTGC